MVTATEERTELAQTEEQPDEEQPEDEGGGDAEGVDPETGEILEPPTVRIFAQNLKVTGQTGKVQVTFEVEGAASGVGVGDLIRMAVIGNAEVAIRSPQAELPL